MVKIKRFYDYDPIFRELESFLSSKTRNLWIHDDPENPIVSIYVRKAQHRAGDKTYQFLDLASITIDESRQGEGIFTNFLQKLIDKYPNTNIYVESILNPAVRHICKKFGFKEQGEENMFLIQESVETVKV